MIRLYSRQIFLFLFMLSLQVAFAQKNYQNETRQEKDQRMKWWRDARFGMFIHWGLYAVPAGEWKNETNHAEWIRTTAQIPLTVYDQFLMQFNPVLFNAEKWVQMAKDAGMKYIVITSKHHDGFCLWDSKQTDFDVMSTPFKRDILKELADAVRKLGGIRLCFYHSIMDWHHPDYSQRREWETDRSNAGADRKRYINYLKSELKELVTNYGDIGVLWFDGEWEDFWTHEDGKDLYNYVRSLKPDIIINNRVDKGRSGMQGMTVEGDYAGDFGTPEQEIPETGLPGTDWESCMTMNNNWGYNKNDHNFKSGKDLIQKLTDIASKGGNFLLNIGPRPDGTFPQESIDRLKMIGDWMSVNGESIYGTKASPFEHIPWGRVTQKQTGNTTRLYLHVFDWPADGRLVLHGIENNASRAFLLSDPKVPLKITREEDALVVSVPSAMPDGINSVIALDIPGKPFTHRTPVFNTLSDEFIKTSKVTIDKNNANKSVIVRYTMDGSTPGVNSKIYSSPILIENTTTIKARNFSGTKPVSGVTEKKFVKIQPTSSLHPASTLPGLKASYYHGDWNQLPFFDTLHSHMYADVDSISTGILAGQEHFGIVFNGYVKIPADDVYTFHLTSDDGSRLFIDDKLLIDHDGLHGMTTKKKVAALLSGFHKLRVEFFQRTGGVGLKLEVESENVKKQQVKGGWVFH